MRVRALYEHHLRIYFRDVNPYPRRFGQHRGAATLQASLAIFLTPVACHVIPAAT